MSVVPTEPAAHEVVDEVLPEEFEWERLVRDYPVPALLLAAAGGFWLGRTRGRTIVSALAAYAGGMIVQEVNDVLGDDVL